MKKANCKIGSICYFLYEKEEIKYSCLFVGGKWWERKDKLEINEIYYLHWVETQCRKDEGMGNGIGEKGEE